jgi:MFS family permease
MTNVPTESTRTQHPAAALAVLLMAPFLAQADATIANVATPAIRVDLGSSNAAIELVIGGYLVSFAVLLITSARLGQTHGYKRLFLLGVTIFGMASLGCSLAPNADILIIMRIVQGAGAALMFPQTLTGIRLNFEGAKLTRAIGLYAIALSAGAVMGQILGGLLISLNIAGTGWRPIFGVNVPICLIVAVAAIRYLPVDRERRNTSVDLLGVAILSVSVLLVVVPLILGQAEGWPAWTWASLATSAPAFWALIATERRVATSGRNPLVNTDVISQPAIAFGLLALGMATASYYALLFTVAQFFQAGLGRSALASGLILVPWVAAFGLAGQIIRRLPDRLGPVLPVVGYLLLAMAYFAISTVMFIGRPGDALFAALLAVGGLGLGTGFATLIRHLSSSVPSRYSSDISGVITTILQIGGAIGIAAVGGIYLTLAAPAGPTTSRHSFAVTALILGTIVLLAALVAYWSTHARASENTDPSSGSGRPTTATQTAFSPDLHLERSRETPEKSHGWRPCGGHELASRPDFQYRSAPRILALDHSERDTSWIVKGTAAASDERPHTTLGLDRCRRRMGPKGSGLRDLERAGQLPGVRRRSPTARPRRG